MTGKYLKTLVLWLHSHNAIDKCDMELYEYAVKVFFLTAFPLIIVFCIECIIGNGINSVLMMIPFFLIRKFSGGFHTKSAWSCFLLSIIVLTFFSCLTQLCKASIIFHFVAFSSIIIIILLSPCESDAREIDFEERNIFKALACKFSLFFYTVYIVLCVLKQDAYGVSIALGVILAALMQSICFFIKIFSKHLPPK